MAVVARKRKGGKTAYYVKFVWNDREIWELAGHDKRAARSLNAQRLREVRDGTYRPTLRVSPTFRSYATTEWLPLRRNRGRDDDRKVIDLHVLGEDKAWFTDLRMDLITDADLRRLVDQWRATPNMARTAKPGETLSDKSVANIYGFVRSIFRHACRRGVIQRDPCMAIDRKEIPRKARSRRARYTLESIRAVLTSDAVHPSARMFAALAFFTGARQGELCGLRWSDWDIGAAPLTCLTIERQYDGRPLKSDDANDQGAHARKVPVHPVLADALLLWWREGWQFVHARTPSLSDPIVPRKGVHPHTKSSSYKMWRVALATAGVDNLSLHVTRHTFISLARRRALAEVVEKITHNAAGAIIDQYTHREWPELCEAVAHIDLNASTPVSLLVSHAPKMLAETVEALGIEPEPPDVTIGNDSRAALNSDDVECSEKQASLTVADADRDARHQRAPRNVITGTDPVARRSPPPWVHEATANLLACLAGVTS